MFGHRSFLMLGSDSGTDILSLMKGGYEILDCNFSFQQQIDHKGKATTKALGGTLNVILAQLPPKEVIEWGIESRKYMGGTIVMLNGENIPAEKISFENAACVHLEVNYIQDGDSYATTRLVIQAEKVIVGNGIDFDNEWTK